MPWNSSNGIWSDVDSIELAAYLQRNHLEVTKDTAYDAVQMVARRNPVHPVRDYLNSLEWDGEPRVDGWLTCYLGVEGNNYTCAVGRCWLISAVARVLSPSCKADAMLVLEGEQGILKSSVPKILAGEWFNGQMPKLDSKDASIQTIGSWIIEIAELSALAVSEVEVNKDFLSRDVDIFRRPYDRTKSHSKRQCVLIGTVNVNGTGAYLKDETGARRFWPVKCGNIKLEELSRDRDQIWAEAVDLYHLGAKWWLSPELEDLAKAEQAERFNTDVWETKIAKYADGHGWDVSIDEVLSYLNVETGRQTQRDKIRVAGVLTRLGLRKYHANEKGIRSYRYGKPSD